MSLQRVYDFFQSARFSDALEEIKLLNEIEKIEGNICKSLIYEQLEKNEEALALADISLEESKKNDNKKLIFASLVAKSRVLYNLYKFEELNQVFQESDDLLKNFDEKQRNSVRYLEYVLNETKGYLNQLQGNLNIALEKYQSNLQIANKMKHQGILSKTYINLGELYIEKGEYDIGLEYLNKCLKINETINNNVDIAYAYLYLGNIFHHKGDLTKALEFHDNSMQLFEETDKKSGLIEVQNRKGFIYLSMGEIDKALEAFLHCLEISEYLGKKYHKITSLQNIGLCYHKNNQLEEALEYLESSFNLWEELGNELNISHSLFYIILIVLDLNDKKRIDEYVNKLKYLDKISENILVNLRFRMAYALYAKQKSRLRMKVMAQKMFEEIVDDKIIDYEISVLALLNLCDLKLFELKNTDEPEILQEAKLLLEKISDLAEKQNSPALIMETLILKSKIAMINFEVETAIELVDEAIYNSKKQGLLQLAKKAELFRKELILEINKWADFTKQNIQYKEQIEHSHIDEYLKEITNLFK